MSDGTGTGTAARATHARSPVLWSALVLAAAFAHNLAVSWMKWGDPVVDGGREMMMPARMLWGEPLYVDHRNVYGPLAPYLGMALYRVFGVHLSVLQGAGIVTAGLMALGVHALARRFLGRAPSVALAVAFLYGLAFAHLTPNPSFNFVVPYACAATYGILAATWSIVLLVRHVQVGRDRDLALSIAGLALAASSKLEALVPTLAAHGTFLACAVLARRLRARHAAFYGAGALLVVAVYGALFLRVGPSLWTDNLGTLFNQDIAAYAAQTTGLDDVSRSLRAIAASAGLLLAVVAVALAAGRLGAGDRRAPVRWAAAVAPPALGFAAWAGAGSDLPFRFLPLLAVAALLLFAWRFLAGRERWPDAAARLVVWAFAAGCLLRLGLYARPAHYGFFLLPVPVVAFGIALFRDLPDAIRGQERERRSIERTGIALLAGFVVAVFATSRVGWAQHDMEVATPRGRMILRGERWQPELVSYLQTLPPAARVAIIPQGAGLLFLAGTRMAGGLYFHAPMEYSGRHTDEKVAAAFAADPPEFVVHLEQDPRSFRYTGFGVEFGFTTAAWLRANYVPVAGNAAVTILQRADLVGPR